MSKQSSAEDEVLRHLDELLGGKAEPISHSDPERQALEASLLADRFRTLLKRAMREDDVGVRALAKRLGVSPSVISRRLSSEGDLKVWTAAVLAHALDRAFSVDLHKTHSNDGRISNRPRTPTQTQQSPPTSITATWAPPRVDPPPDNLDLVPAVHTRTRDQRLMAKSPPLPVDVLATVVCDDIRREASGKEILIGVYSGDILVKRFPANILLAIWIQVRPRMTEATEMEFRLTLDGAPLSSGLFELTVTDSKQIGSIHLAPVPASCPAPGTIAVQIRRKEGTWRTLRQIEIKLPPDASPQAQIAA